MKSSPLEFKSCFISAPFAADLGMLSRLLDELNIHWEWANTSFAQSERLPGDVRKIIRNVDFVLGVLVGGPANENTMFEIGVAVGTGKPVLLIVTDSDQVPENLKGLPYVRASLYDPNPIKFHIDLLMRSSRQRPRYPASGGSFKVSVGPSRVPGIGGTVLHDSQPDSPLEAELVSLVSQAGGHVLLHPRGAVGVGKFVPDLLVWLPIIDPELLNPAVVEVKGHTPPQPQLLAAEEQLAEFMEQTGLRTGLILVRGLERDPQISVSGTQLLNVFVMDFEMFGRLLSTGQLANNLREERNRAAHGLR